MSKYSALGKFSCYIIATAVAFSSSVAARKERETLILLRKTQHRVGFVGARVYLDSFTYLKLLSAEVKISEVAPPYLTFFVFVACLYFIPCM